MTRYAPLVVLVAWLLAGAPINVYVHQAEPAASADRRTFLVDDSDLVLDEPVVVSGVASWYDAERDGQSAWYTRAGIRYYAAAGPELRRALGGYAYREAYQVRITNEATGTYAVAWVVDWCQCSKGDKTEKIIDLSPALFEALGVNLSRGVQRVTIEIVD